MRCDTVMMNNFPMERNCHILILLGVIVTAMGFPTLNKMQFHEGIYRSLLPAYQPKLHTSTATDIYHSFQQIALKNSNTKQKNQKNHLVYHNGNIPGDTVFSQYVAKGDVIDVLYKNSHLISDSPRLALNSSKILHATNKTHKIVKRSRNSDLMSVTTASDFVFPGRPRNFAPVQDVKTCSQDGIDLCVSNVLDYPYSHIKRILKNRTFDFKRYFTDDVIDVSTRFDEGVDDEMLCGAEETVIYPKFGKTANDDMLFIINIDESFKQGVRVERCKKSGESPCKSLLETPRTYCKQKYAYRKLLALQPNGKPMPDNFKIPSCCSCYISDDLTSFRGLLKRIK